MVASGAPGPGFRPELLDLAHGHPGDPHVGLLGELRGLGERRLEAVALRLERHGAAEGQPEEQQQPEARQGEDDHDEDPPGARGGLLHQPPPSRSGRRWPWAGVAAAAARPAGVEAAASAGQTSGTVGALSRPTRTPSCSLTR
jgi:hypothetical protein